MLKLIVGAIVSSVLASCYFFAGYHYTVDCLKRVQQIVRWKSDEAGEKGRGHPGALHPGDQDRENRSD
jgi:hypothetical protein